MARRPAKEMEELLGRLPGTVFGELTVEAVYKDGRYYKCRCRCSCGRETEVYYSNLSAGKTRSCGCLEKENQKRFRDITGRRFGSLTALRPTEERRGRAVVWECRCDCGNTCLRTVQALLGGRSTHCGCKRKAPGAEARDLTGQRFGRLTVLGATEKREKNGSVVWRCRCDCGTETEAGGDRLVRGYVVSCGCRKKELQKELYSCLHCVDGTCVEALKRKQRSDNTSGHTGVYRTREGRYQAQITFKGKRHRLGIYETFEEAVRAREEGEERYHKAFLESYGRGEN